MGGVLLRVNQSNLEYRQSKSKAVYVTIELLVSPARHFLNKENKEREKVRMRATERHEERTKEWRGIE
jgi:hypothetical protein